MAEDTKIEDQAEELENTAEEQDQPQAESQFEDKVDDTNDSEPAEVEKDPMTELQEKYDILNDKYLRMYSEFENFRRRTAKEKLDLVQTAGGNVVKDLLTVVDDFDRAIAANENNDDPRALKEGFNLIHNKLLHVLEQKGLKPMNSLGEKFDTEYHEAITNIPAPSEDMKGKVVDVAEKGYFYHDSILRYAKVIVGQ